MVEEPAGDQPLEILPDHEELQKLLANGTSVAEAARKFGVSESTVRMAIQWRLAS